MIAVAPAPANSDLLVELKAFQAFGTATRVSSLAAPDGAPVPVVTSEFWTAQQRAAHRLHEVSYRACFKPQLPRFFIERFTQPGDLVYDPFMGRGTTLLEAMLLGRRVAGCDVNPVRRALIEPRLNPPSPAAIAARLTAIPLEWTDDGWTELEVFCHPETLREPTALRGYMLAREAAGTRDKVDRWIRMVAMGRVFTKLRRVLRPGGCVAFEVGKVHKGTVRLEEQVLATGTHASLAPELILIQEQDFTKTANGWGVDNDEKGTNTNRVVLFRRPA